MVNFNIVGKGNGWKYPGSDNLSKYTLGPGFGLDGNFP